MQQVANEGENVHDEMSLNDALVFSNLSAKKSMIEPDLLPSYEDALENVSRKYFQSYVGSFVQV